MQVQPDARATLDGPPPPLPTADKPVAPDLPGSVSLDLPWELAAKSASGVPYGFLLEEGGDSVSAAPLPGSGGPDDGASLHDASVPAGGGAEDASARGSSPLPPDASGAASAPRLRPSGATSPLALSGEAAPGGSVPTQGAALTASPIPVPVRSDLPPPPSSGKGKKASGGKSVKSAGMTMPSLISGWIFKKRIVSRGISTWKKRFCTVCDTSFYYYTSDTAHAPKGVLDLTQCAIVSHPDADQERYVCFVLDSPKYPYLFGFLSREDMMRWIAVCSDLVRSTDSFH